MGYNFLLAIWSIFIRLAVIAPETREMSRNSNRIWPYSSSRSFKVIDLGINGKPICDFLLVINCNFSRICYRDGKLLILPTHPLFDAPAFEFCDEIWHQKTRIVGLPDGEVPFFVLTQYRLVTDRRTDRQTLVIISGNSQCTCITVHLG